MSGRLFLSAKPLAFLQEKKNICHFLFSKNTILDSFLDLKCNSSIVAILLNHQAPPPPTPTHNPQFIVHFLFIIPFTQLSP